MGNSSAAQTFAWQVLPTTPLFSGDVIGSMSNKGYLIDNGGMGHIFVAGTGLHHFYETSPGTFAHEWVTPEATAYAVPVFDPTSDTFHVLYQNAPSGEFAPVGVSLASGNVSSWTTKSLLNERVSPYSIDLVLASDGTLSAAYTRCTGPTPGDCFVNGGYLDDFTVEVAHIAATTTVETLPAATRAFYPTLALDNVGDMWLSYRNTASPNAVMLVKKETGLWQTPIVVSGSGAPVGAPNIDSRAYQGTTLTVDSNNRPLLTFKPALNDKFWAVSYDGAVLDFTNTNESSLHSQLGSAASNRWYVSARNPATVQRRDTAGVWTQSSINLSEHPERVSGVLLTDGDFGVDARLHAVFAYGNVHKRIERVVQDGASVSSSVIVPLDRYRSFNVVSGAAVPTVVVGSPTELQVLSYAAGAWSVNATVRSDLVSNGYDLHAVKGSSDTWIAHTDSGGSGTQIFVEQGNGLTWTTHGPISPGGINIQHLRTALLPNGNPIAVYVRHTSPYEIHATWWDGAQFTTITALAAVNANQIGDLAIIGDHNGAAAGGETWVAYADRDNLEIRVIRFDSSGENPSIAGCETCVQESVVGAQQSYITAGMSPLCPTDSSGRSYGPVAPTDSQRGQLGQSKSTR
ncbi:MAG: hypothetical protein R3C68_10000 [Myxococcota bacterium]